MIGCAQQEYAEAMVKLKTVAWWRRRKIVELQNKAWRAECFMVWLRDLVIKGKAAELALEEGEETANEADPNLPSGPVGRTAAARPEPAESTTS
jgi:hypothetical protein